MRRFKHGTVAGWFVAGLLLSGVLPAAAQTHTEVGDAGELISTAQDTSGSGSGPLTKIDGTITPSNADMYCIKITGAFSATTVGGATWDTQLFLFDSAGMGIFANDDSASTFQSTISGAPAPGTYFLAISPFDYDPVSAGGLIFPSSPFSGLYGPTGPGGASPHTGWTGGGGPASASYSIFLTGVEFCDSAHVIPEPATMVLLAPGLAVIGLLRRRRKREG